MLALGGGRPHHRLQRAAPGQRQPGAVDGSLEQQLGRQRADAGERVGAVGGVGPDRYASLTQPERVLLQSAVAPGRVVDPDLDDAAIERGAEHPRDVGPVKLTV